MRTGMATSFLLAIVAFWLWASREVGVLVLAQSSSSDCAGATPLSFPITDVHVREDIPRAYMKGIPLRIGDPPQTLALLPWPELNNTWLYNTSNIWHDYDPVLSPDELWQNLTAVKVATGEFCAHEGMLGDMTYCEVRRGGLYWNLDSKSYSALESSLGAAGGAAVETDGGFGWRLDIDDLIRYGFAGKEAKMSLGDGEKISEDISALTFGMPQYDWDTDGFSFQHQLGLGRNSTVLNLLRDAGRIAGRSWSIWWGNMWVSYDNDTDFRAGAAGDVDGALVLGGYDRGRVLGQGHTQRLDYNPSTGCWTGMSVLITDITLNWKDSEKREPLLPGGTTLVPACLMPQEPFLVQGPRWLGPAWERAVGEKADSVTFGYHWSTLSYQPMNRTFDGTITFKFRSNLTVTIDNSQFNTPKIYYVDKSTAGSVPAPRGSRTYSFPGLIRNILISNVSSLTANLDAALEAEMNGVPSGEMLVLGRYFFTGSLLAVDHDKGEFTLWEANQDREAKPDLVVLGEGCAPPSNTDSEDGGAGPRPGGNSTSSSDNKIPDGAIAGVVVGSVTGAIGIGFILGWLIWRRRQRQLQARSFLFLQGRETCKL